MREIFSKTLAGTLALALWAGAANATNIDVQSRFPPLLLNQAPPGGAHPVGGPAKAFVDLANETLSGVRFNLHISGNISPFDRDAVEPRLVAIGDFGTLHNAVAVGEAGGGIDAAIDIAINNGFPFGELFVAGLPFGMAPDEYAAYLYEGGGLGLQQALYDEKFDDRIVVVPIAITTAQGAGWFPEPLPDPDDLGVSDDEAMRRLCRMEIIVRWAEPGGGVLRKACETAGAPANFIGTKTRCVQATEPCPSAGNPLDPDVVVDALTFGGFTPGVLPQLMLNTGNIDAHEFNLPSADVQFYKLALGKAVQTNAEADISEVVGKAPFQYAGAWHQPLSYIELIVNKGFWSSLPAGKRRAIRMAARSSALFSLAARLNLQGDAMAKLADSGAVHSRWPDGLLRVLRQATDDFLDAKADDLAAAGDDSYRQVVDSMRSYIERQKAYFDFGDINQGQNETPTAPLP